MASDRERIREMERMRAVRRRTSPAEQLRVALAEHRAAGHSFDEAWEQTFRSLAWEHDTMARHDSKAVLSEHRPIWEAAYNREPVSQLDPFRAVSLGPLDHSQPEYVAA